MAELELNDPQAPPSVAESLRPPSGGGADLLGGLTRRLKIIGVPLETVYA